MSKKTRYVAKFTEKETGNVSYFRTLHTKNEVINGVKCLYYEYELTNDIEKANTFDCALGVDILINKIRENQPAWAGNFNIESHRLPSRREQIALDISPLTHMVKLVKGYSNASVKGKMAIRKKLFQQELIEACLASLENINKLK